METIPIEIYEHILNYVIDIKNIRCTSTKFLSLTNNLFYYKYFFVYSKICHNHTHIQNLKNVDNLNLDKFTNLRIIYFDRYFNQHINKMIPQSVTHLYFGTCFNKELEIGDIPPKVTHLSFGWFFNKNIKNCIPEGVTHLSFGLDFNQNIEGSIPNSVTNLTFRINFYKNIHGKIPKTCNVFFC